MEKRNFECSRRNVTLYCSEQIDSPLIILNNYSGDGSSVIGAMRKIETPECNLLVIGNLEWDHDMTPWYCPPITENDTPCTGGADEYLDLLLNNILLEALNMLEGKPPFIGIAGYSLAGLFALYAMYRCNIFDRVASMSGSLWFPEFKEFVFSQEVKKKPGRLYLSLGDREAKTRNPFLKTIQENTEAILEHYKRIGLDVVWELNPGNHFKDAALRSAKGIKSILE